MSRLGISNRLGQLGMVWDGLYLRAALWEACWGVLFRGDSELYRFSLFCSEKLAFYAMAGIMGEIFLLMA